MVELRRLLLLNKKIGADIVKDSKMKVVHDKDLENLLNSLNVYEDVLNGKHKCLFCGQIITIDNIDSIVPYHQTVQFTCDKQECHAKLIGMGKINNG